MWTKMSERHYYAEASDLRGQTWLPGSPVDHFASIARVYRHGVIVRDTDGDVMYWEAEINDNLYTIYND